MGSPSVLVPLDIRNKAVLELVSPQDGALPAVSARAIRGAMTGVVLGTSLWGVIIVGLVALFK